MVSNGHLNSNAHLEIKPQKIHEKGEGEAVPWERQGHLIVHRKGRITGD
jgi:hypothetical protein